MRMGTYRDITTDVVPPFRSHIELAQSAFGAWANEQELQATKQSKF